MSEIKLLEMLGIPWLVGTPLPSLSSYSYDVLPMSVPVYDCLLFKNISHARLETHPTPV